THLYVCEDEMFGARCDNLHVAVGQCYNLDASWNDKITSLGPDKGTFCTLYSEFDCKGKVLPLTYPGVKDLARYQFGDVGSSYRCDFIAEWSGKE
ncbi:hypothetical protein BDV95DRAFT_487956, partial [Massariosphaeria phaeospora]